MTFSAVGNQAGGTELWVVTLSNFRRTGPLAAFALFCLERCEASAAGHTSGLRAYLQAPVDANGDR